ncbi:hypothetical protein [Halococcus salsus]|nr:hypothetical protein [Halococcus salsus]
MSPLTIATVNTLIVLMCEVCVLTEFITGYLARARDEWEHESGGECR